LLVTIVQMAAAKQINTQEKTVLKMLALKGDRLVLSALKAYQSDHVSLQCSSQLLHGRRWSYCDLNRARQYSVPSRGV